MGKDTLKGPRTAHLRCTCVSKFQDKRYGRQIRLMNRCEPNSTYEKFRCTICGHERTIK